MTPRFIVPPLFWLVLSITSLAGAFSVWQNDRLERMRPPAVAAPALPAATPQPKPPPEPAREPPPPGPTAVQRGTAVSTLSVGPAEPPRDLDPTARRLVLRCTIKGRVTYRDLSAGCPDGAAEKVTEFPTEGVGRPK